MSTEIWTALIAFLGTALGTFGGILWCSTQKWEIGYDVSSIIFQQIICIMFILLLTQLICYNYVQQIY